MKLTTSFKTYFHVSLVYRHSYRKDIVVLPADEVRILAGAHDLNFLEGTEKEILGQETFLHADFNSETLDNNIALLHLSKSIIFNNHTRSVCLPNDQTTFDYSSCRSAGWTTSEFTIY